MNTLTPFFPTTLRSRGLLAVSRPDGRWRVRGRGNPPTIKTHEELQALLNTRPKGKRG